jgi:hypothetical protein
VKAPPAGQSPRNEKRTAFTKIFVSSEKLQTSLMILKQLPSSPLNVQRTALGHSDLGPAMMRCASLCQPSASSGGTLPYEEAHATWIFFLVQEVPRFHILMCNQFGFTQLYQVHPGVPTSKRGPSALESW